MDKPRAIIVLGMHRSGTSAITRTLNLCGVDLGKYLMPPGREDNIKGFWEHWDIYQANEKLLHGLNSSWDDVRALPERWWDTDSAKAYRLEIINILNRDFSESPLWGVKDPRICRLLRLWIPLLDQIGSRPRFLIIVRNPLEVAASLRKRDGFSTGKSCLLWLKHLMESEKGTRNRPRMFATYDALLSDWKSVMSRAEQIFGLTWPIKPEEACHQIDAFLEDTLRHNRVKNTSLIQDTGLSKWIKTAYLSVMAAIDLGDKQLIRTIDAIEDELNDALGLYEPAFTELWENYRAGNKQLQEQGRLLEDTRHSLDEVIRERAYHQSNSESLKAVIKEKNVHITHLESKLRDTEYELSEAKQTVVRLESEDDLLQKIVKERDERIQQMDKALGDLQESIAETKQAVMEQEKERGYLQSSMKDKDEHITHLESKLRDAEHELSEAKQTVVRLESEDDLLQKIVKEKDERIQQMDKELPKLREAFAESKQAVMEHEKDLELLRVFIQERDKHLQRLRTDNAGLQERHVAMERSMGERQSELDRLRSVGAKKDEQIARLESNLRDAENELSRANETVVRLETAYDHLHKGVEEREEHIQQMDRERPVFEKEVKEQQSKLCHLEREIAEKNDRIDQLNAALGRLQEDAYSLRAHMENYRLVWESMLESTSWKFTAPLRWMSVNAKNLKRKLKFVPYLIAKDYRVIKKSGLFDMNYYLRQNPDVAQAKMNPLVHYLVYGYKEGRDPNPDFNARVYSRRNWDTMRAPQNPLIHYIKYGDKEQKESGSSPRDLAEKTNSISFETNSRPPSEPDKNVVNEEHIYRAYHRPEKQSIYEPEENPNLPNTSIKLLAFYFPQYHPFEENDRFWGKGFTEWTSTTKALPLFEGQYQPRLPGELGFYDTRIKDVIIRQIELAKQYGIYGFCLHHYFFDGKPVMRVPFNHIMSNKDLDIPFCLHWANEPWTIRWDGFAEKGGVLLDQHHTPEDDAMFFKDIEPALRDERYIRVHNRPLLIIYRPSLFPDIKSTIERWRDLCHKNGIGELYLAVMQTGFDGNVDPRHFGFDAAIEYPPHNVRAVSLKGQVDLFDPSFQGNIFSYPEMVKGALERPVPDYTLFRGVMPDWDCTPRRSNPDIFIGSTPEKYQKWLEGACSYTQKNLPVGERIVFINAWNEWAEGAYLEPDRKYGYAYLNATAKALEEYPFPNYVRKIVFLGHDAARAGAQILLLHLLRWLKKKTLTEICIVLGAGGVLLEEYQEIGDVLVLSSLVENGCGSFEIENAIRAFSGHNVDLIYANTVTSGKYLRYFEFMKAPVITHVHELEKSITNFAGKEAMASAIKYTNKYIAASPAVGQNLKDNHGIQGESIECVYAFICPGSKMQDEMHDRDKVKEALDIDPGRIAIFGCGSRDWRKGPDLFVKIAERLKNKGFSRFHFYWIGAKIPGEYERLEDSVSDKGLKGYVTFLGEKENPIDYFAAGDIFLLPSREDPFPLVCLEAAEQGLPVVCFSDAGGMPDFVEDDAGYVVPYEDLERMTEKVALLISDGEERKKKGRKAREKLLERHTVDSAMPEILQIINKTSKTNPAVSVIVPNFNHERFLAQRLDSILSQTFQDFEIIIQDDCSTDNSLHAINEYLSKKNVALYKHSENSGVFEMWVDGLEAAKADIIWIAEADDFCNPQFLETLLPFFKNEKVKLAYAQSYAVDVDGHIMGDYLNCFPEFQEKKWEKSYIVTANDEVKECLGIKNTILNASAVLFRKPSNLSQIKETLTEFRLSGDWYFYLNIIRGGMIAYCPEILNYHRRHDATNISRFGDTDVAIMEADSIHRFVLDRYPVTLEIKQKMMQYIISVWKNNGGKRNLEDLKELYSLCRTSGMKEVFQTYVT